MKKLVVGTLALAASLALGAAVFAAGTEVLKGTPVIDGKKDALYNNTVAHPVSDNLVFAGSSVDWSAADDPYSDAKATAYLLYDDDYFYVYGEVTDDDIMFNNEATAPPENPWDQDAFENWVDLGDGVFKASVSPFIDYVFATDATFDPADCKFAVVKGDKSYTIELAIPHSGLAEGGTISYVLQLNDYGRDGYMRCYGAQAAGVEEYKLGGPAK